MKRAAIMEVPTRLALQMEKTWKASMNWVQECKRAHRDLRCCASSRVTGSNRVTDSKRMDSRVPADSKAIPMRPQATGEDLNG